MQRLSVQTLQRVKSERNAYNKILAFISAHRDTQKKKGTKIYELL